MPQNLPQQGESVHCQGLEVRYWIQKGQSWKFTLWQTGPCGEQVHVGRAPQVKQVLRDLQIERALPGESLAVA